MDGSSLPPGPMMRTAPGLTARTIVPDGRAVDVDLAPVGIGLTQNPTLRIERLIKFAVAFGLILAGAWFAYARYFSPVSSEATLTAELVSIKAPIPGVLHLTAAAVGTYLPAARAFGDVVNERADTGRLHALQSDLALINGEIDSLRRRDGELSRMMAELRHKAEVYRVGRRQLLEARLEQMRQAAVAAEAREREAARTYQRVASLNHDGFATRAALDEAERVLVVAHTESTTAGHRAHELEIEVKLAEDGVFAGDSIADVSQAQQMINQLALRQETVRSDLSERLNRLPVIEAQLAEETARNERLRHASLSIDMPVRLWSLAAGNGQAVSEGQEIARAVNCRHSFVSAVVPERVFNRLRIGTTATITIDGRKIEGTVAQLRGPGTTGTEDLALADPRQSSGRFRVLLNAEALGNGEATSCVIGQSADVAFDS